MATFGVSARALLHLGSELITSDAIAIYELIKNSIDARAEEILVHFDCPFSYDQLNDLAEEWIKLKPEEWNSIKNEDLKILIEDMRSDVSETQRIRVTNTIKKIQKSKSIKYAVDKLLSLNRILFRDDGTGMSKTILEEAFLTVGTPYKFNTSVDDDPVLGNKGIGRLAMMRLGSKTYVRTWKNKDEYHRIVFEWDKFKDPSKMLSDIHFKVNKFYGDRKSESGTSIIITKLNRDWLSTDIKDEIVERLMRRLRNPFNENDYKYELNIKYNNSDRFPIKDLSPQLRKFAQKHLVMSFKSTVDIKESALFLEIIDCAGEANKTTYQADLKTIAHQFSCSVNDLRKVGDFKFNLLWFNRSVLKTEIKNAGLSNAAKAIVKELDLWGGGVAIYRDGYRIGLSGSQEDKDWLELDRQALRGQGFVVNRIQIVAALDITKNLNPYLEDRSNREGLIENKQVNLVRDIIKKIGLQELREEINKDKNKKVMDQLSEIVENGVDQATDKIENIRALIKDLDKHADAEQKEILRVIKEDLHFIANQVVGFDEAATHLISQREDILELAGAGTMMHSVLHELARTTEQTKEIIFKLSKKTDKDVSELLVKLEREIKTINTRVRQFDPLSPSGRNRRSVFDLVGSVKTVISGYKNRFDRHLIDIDFLIDDKNVENESYQIKMVMGFLFITLENLFSNSVYWLKQDDVFSKLPGSSGRWIKIEIDTISRTISFSDNGPGISVADRERIFDAGFSTKKSLKDGKGFGLFIAREIIRFHKGNIYLSQEKDADGRLRTFIVELPKE